MDVPFPVITELHIHGVLELMPRMAYALNCQTIYVSGSGQLIIGTSEEPMQRDVNITLSDENSEYQSQSPFGTRTIGTSAIQVFQITYFHLSVQNCVRQ